MHPFNPKILVNDPLSKLSSANFDVGVPRFMLICHGMMMFHWDYKHDPDHITILIHEMSEHKVALSTQRGALTPTGTEDNLFSGTGHYELMFTPGFTRPANATPPSSSRDVVLDSRKLAPLGQRSLRVNLAHVTHTLKIPYPSQVLRGRVAALSSGAYTGTTATGFNVAPAQIAGMHVFAYDGVQAAALRRLMPAATVALWSPDSCFKLYLYSEERRGQAPPMNHLDDFNQLVTYDVANLVHNQLIYTSPALQKNAAATAEIQADSASVDCLVPEDYFPLNQFPISNTQLRQAKPGNSNSGQDVQSNADPIQCLQGWGT